MMIQGYKVNLIWWELCLQKPSSLVLCEVEENKEVKEPANAVLKKRGLLREMLDMHSVKSKRAEQYTDTSRPRYYT